MCDLYCNLNPASARTHSVQALDSYSEMKFFGNHNKDCAQRCHSLYESISCTAQARLLAGSRCKFKEYIDSDLHPEKGTPVSR